MGIAREARPNGIRCSVESPDLSGLPAPVEQAFLVKGHAPRAEIFELHGKAFIRARPRIELPHAKRRVVGHEQLAAMKRDLRQRAR